MIIQLNSQIVPLFQEGIFDGDPTVRHLREIGKGRRPGDIAFDRATGRARGCGVGNQEAGQ